MKVLKLKINDKDYSLCMDRETIKWLERMGFTYEEFTQKPITYRELLWECLFIRNHPEVSHNLAIKLMDTYAKEHGETMVNKVVKFANDEYISFINALIDTNSEKNEELEIIEQ